ncbi:MAG TPA: flavin reductase family protein [Streptosporangiaceae bacterium]|jgi:flavin reductase (DIM6/NTAB) family NADH-FMN oxidoreductase RutF
MTIACADGSHAADLPPAAAAAAAAVPRGTGRPGLLRIHDEAELRRVFGAFPTGVTAVAALAGGMPLGLAASSFTSVSLDPPIVSVCIARGSRTWPRLGRARRLGISVLGAHQEQASRQLAAAGPDRFARLDWRATADGAVLVEGASAWLDCSVETAVPAGDHEMILLRVHELDADPAVPPLVFHASRYRRLLP